MIHQRLQYLLCNAVAVGLLVGGWMIWADVFPALKVLDKQALWHSTVDVVEMHQDASGNQIPQRVSTVVPTTARHALIAGLILIAAFVIGRHLPALLEITLLGRMRFDKGGRHAISVLLRYLVALIGVFMACRTLSITWGSVQWLAAGMTVGLGFGLQEIFANFISGLILLFERPIRVGDVITLGDTTGTVTDIRIRATTVMNWDRKELIVPNKELITGRLLNWTLSDPVKPRGSQCGCGLQVRHSKNPQLDSIDCGESSKRFRRSASARHLRILRRQHAELRPPLLSLQHG